MIVQWQRWPLATRSIRVRFSVNATSLPFFVCAQKKMKRKRDPIDEISDQLYQDIFEPLCVKYPETFLKETVTSKRAGKSQRDEEFENSHCTYKEVVIKYEQECETLRRKLWKHHCSATFFTRQRDLHAKQEEDAYNRLELIRELRSNAKRRATYWKTVEKCLHHYTEPLPVENAATSGRLLCNGCCINPIDISIQRFYPTFCMKNVESWELDTSSRHLYCCDECLQVIEEMWDKHKECRKGFFTKDGTFKNLLLDNNIPNDAIKVIARYLWPADLIAADS